VVGGGVNVVVGVGILSSPTPARVGKSWTSMLSVTTFMKSSQMFAGIVEPS
jgi:hypothetical protein